jgi:hypothetical protein
MDIISKIQIAKLYKINDLVFSQQINSKKEKEGETKNLKTERKSTNLSTSHSIYTFIAFRFHK